MGMNKDAVQNERQPRNTATIRPEALREMSQGRALREACSVAVGVFGPPVSLSMLSPSRYTSALFTPTAPFFHHNPMTSNLTVPNGLSNHHHSLGNSLTLDTKLSPVIESQLRANLSCNPSTPTYINQENGETSSPKSSPSSKAFNDNNDEDSIDVTNTNDVTVDTEVSKPESQTSLLYNQVTYNYTQAETIYETSARLLFMAVKWAKNLPSFASLAFRDQIILLEESWAELFLLNAIQWSMPLEVSSCTLFSITEHDQDSNNETKQGQFVQDIRILNDILCRFKTVLVDPAEFACMKAIVLFRSESRGLKDPAQIENLQDQAQVMLYQHCKAQFPERSSRFGRLLLMIPLLRQVNSHRIEMLYFQKTIGNTPMEKVLCDMYRN
uniref:CSON011497 protein n=1 Tax=Culicoides sonorensis TaxID=179676 RepID=A0A336LLQ1_CULSO